MLKDVLVTIKPQYLDQLESIANALHDDGLQISDIKGYGLIMGKSEQSALNVLKQHKEVVDVEEEQFIQLVPPNADVQ